MRVHVFRTTFSIAFGDGATSTLSVVLTYRIVRGDEVEIQTARVLSEEAPNWLLRRIENDRTLTRRLLAHAEEDIAFDRRKAMPAALARAA